MEKTEIIQYWVKAAEQDLDTAKVLYKHKRYNWCLFLGHLALEKIIKAHFVNDNPDEPVPLIHNLTKLAEKTKLQLSDDQKVVLTEINQFNIKVRYPDYKFEFIRNAQKNLPINISNR
jgi:AbiV family abortive infection protein